MQGDSLLELIAELAVALAGFSGVVTVLRGRNSEQLKHAELMGLIAMLHASFLAGGLALVPFIFYHAGLSEGAIWGSAGTVGAVIQAVRLGGRRGRTFASFGLPENQRFGYWMFRSITGATLLLYLSQVVGVPFGRTFAPYLVALLLHLAAAAAIFFRLLTPKCAPSNTHQPPVCQLAHVSRAPGLMGSREWWSKGAAAGRLNPGQIR